MAFNIWNLRKEETRNNDITRQINMITSSFTSESLEFSSIDALENSDVYTGINILASDVSSLPIRIINSKKERNTNLEFILNNSPNAIMSGRELMSVLVINAILNGNSYAEIVRDEFNRPISIEHIANSRVVNIKKRSTAKHIKELEYEVSNYGTKGGTRRIKGQDMIHIKLFSKDGINGVSPLKALKSELKSAKDSKKFYRDFFTGSTNSSGILKFQGDLTAEDKIIVREEWTKAHAGGENNHKIIVLSESEEYESIEIDTEILKLINESRVNTETIARVLRIPLSKFGLETANQSMQQSSSEYLTDTLNSYISAIESEFNKKLFVTTEEKIENQFQLDVSDYNYSDYESKQESVQSMFSNSLITLNEARQKLGLEPLENGDYRLQSLNYIQAEHSTEYQLGRIKNGDTEALQGGEEDSDGN